MKVLSGHTGPDSYLPFHILRHIVSQEPDFMHLGGPLICAAITSFASTFYCAASTSTLRLPRRHRSTRPSTVRSTDRKSYWALQELSILEWQVPVSFNLNAPSDGEKSLPLRLLDNFRFFVCNQNGKEVLESLDSLVEGELISSPGSRNTLT